MQELAIAAVPERLVNSGAPAIAEKISSRNEDCVIVGLTLDSQFVGGDGLSYVHRFKLGFELQVIAEDAICNFHEISLGWSHDTAEGRNHVGWLASWLAGELACWYYSVD